MLKSLHTRKVLFKQIANESCLASRILTNQKNHWSGIKIRITELRRMEVMEEVVLLKRQDLALVDLL